MPSENDDRRPLSHWKGVLERMTWHPLTHHGALEIDFQTWGNTNRQRSFDQFVARLGPGDRKALDAVQGKNV